MPVRFVLTFAAGLCVASSAMAQTKPEETEVWKPAVPVVATSGAAPSDAIVLFDGHDLGQWVATKDKSPAAWTVADGVLTVDKARGNIETKRAFRDYQLHLEWRIPGRHHRLGPGAGQQRRLPGVDRGGRQGLRGADSRFL
jgi:hypothetical protein